MLPCRYKGEPGSEYLQSAAVMGGGNRWCLWQQGLYPSQELFIFSGERIGDIGGKIMLTREVGHFQFSLLL